jgi:hypothetical protein
MNKKRKIEGIVLLGIGLSLLALGMYLKIVLADNIVYEQLISMQVLKWSVVALGLALILAGGIRLYKGRFK